MKAKTSIWNCWAIIAFTYVNHFNLITNYHHSELKDKILSEMVTNRKISSESTVNRFNSKQRTRNKVKTSRQSLKFLAFFLTQMSKCFGNANVYYIFNFLFCQNMYKYLAEIWSCIQLIERYRQDLLGL